MSLSNISHIDFTSLEHKEESVLYYDINQLLSQIPVLLEDTAQRTNNIERILKENKRDIEKDIIVKGENIFFSKYAVYMFLERIDKFLFPNIDIYKEIKAYFYEKDFVGWGNDKPIIDQMQTHKFLKPREIWDCKLGVNIGNESNGKGKHMRPVLILQRVGNVFLVAPLTKHGKTKEQDGGKYYYTLDGYFGIDSFVMLSQIRTIDKNRCIKHMNTIADEDYNSIMKEVQDLFFSPSKDK